MPENIVPFFLKEPVGQLPAGPGRLVYDRMAEALRIVPNFSADDAILLTEDVPCTNLPQDAISRIHFQKALLFGGGNIVIRLRNGKQSEWLPFFGAEEFSFPVKRKHEPNAEEMVKEIKFDLFEDTLDDMLDTTEETLGY